MCNYVANHTWNHRDYTSCHMQHSLCPGLGRKVLLCVPLAPVHGADDAVGNITTAFPSPFHTQTILSSIARSGAGKKCVGCSCNTPATGPYHCANGERPNTDTPSRGGTMNIPRRGTCWVDLRRVCHIKDHKMKGGGTQPLIALSQCIFNRCSRLTQAELRSMP